VAEIAGDHKAAREVQLVLPETGVCSADLGSDAAKVSPESSCCGGPAPETIDACCVADAKAKASGRKGCGCGSDRSDPVPAGTALETTI